MKNLVSLALAGAMLVTAPAGAATLVVNSDGILTGATGVTVGTKTYDVVFADGTCAQVYGECKYTSFAFDSVQDARAAATALTEQVFVNSTAGDFRYDPRKIAGCGSSMVCTTLIAYDLSEDPQYVETATTVLFGGTKGVSRTTTLVTFDSSKSTDLNFARFTLAVTGAVPEPATWAMMLVGFGAIGAAMRRRRGVAVHFA